MTDSRVETLLRDALADPDPPDHAVRRARELMPSGVSAAIRDLMERAAALVADLRLDSRAAAAMPGFRGGASGFQLLYTAKAHEMFLRVEPPVRAGGEFSITGQVEARERDGAWPRVVIVGQDRISADMVPDAEGMFRCILPAGCYSVAVGSEPPFLVRELRLE